MNKLSIAIPTYNREKYLCDCLESLKQQSSKDFSVVIFDNASEYDITSIVSRFPELKIKLFISSTNTGGGGNAERIKNYAFDTEYLMVFHDDDTMHKDYVRDAMDFLNANKTVLWLGSNLSFVHDDEGMMNFKGLSTKHGFRIVDTNGLLFYLFKDFDLQFGSVIYKTNVFQSNDFPVELCDKWCDRPFLINISKIGPVAVTEDHYINYRIHKGQDSRQPSEKFDKLLNLFKYYRDNSLNSPSILRSFYLWSTNQSINSSANFSNSYAAFRSYMRQFRLNGLIKWSSIRPKGICYFFRFLLKLSNV